MKKQIGINMIANLTWFLVGLAINFFFMPYLIGTVGIEAYSFMPLTTNITNCTTIISAALNALAARFVSVEFHKNNIERSNSYFNTILFSNIFLSVIFSLFFSGIVVFLEHIFNVPTEILVDIKWLFALTFLGSVFTLLCSTFEIATFVRNRLDLRSGLLIFNSIFKVILLLLLFWFFEPNILFMGIATLAIAVISLLVNMRYQKTLLPEIIIDHRKFRVKDLKMLLGSGVWSAVSRCSDILMLGFDLIFANIFLNATLAGNLSVSKTIPSQIFTFSSLLVTAFAPSFTILYAQDKKKELLQSVFSSLKILTACLSVPLAGVVVFGIDFYHLWIPGQDIDMIYTLTIITMIPTFVSVFVGPLTNIYTVTNRLKKPVLFTFGLGIVNVVVVLLFLNLVPQYGIYAIAGTSGFLLLLNYALFLPIYSAKCLGVKKNSFYPHIFRSVFATLVMIGLFYVIRKVFPVSSWGTLFVTVAICVVFGFAINVIMIFNHAERKQFWNIIRTKLLKK